MQKLFMLTFVLLLVFSGSVIASSAQNSNRNNPTEDYKSKTGINPEGYTCWQCTKYAYYNGYRTCVSGVWLTTCPVTN
ncbi:hypothetical protein [Mesobacillus thioparans]|uniref:hypothetical protein n=1 Tax=Mesobacillus thioparans TaxID=370439 RepID=UPI0039EF975C